MSYVNEVIGAAKRMFGDKTPISDGDMFAFNTMLAEWSAKGVVIPTATEETFTLNASTSSATIGSGGDFDTTQPIRIFKAFLRDTSTDYDYPLIIADRDRFYGFTDRANNNAQPAYIYFERGASLGTIYFYPIPTEAYTLHLVNEVEHSKVNYPTATLALPNYYDEAVKFNISERLAPEYSKEPTPTVKRMARETYNTISGVTKTVPTATLDFGTGGGSWKYSGYPHIMSYF